MIALLLAAALLGSPVVCTTPQPGPEWVCVGDGWLPPGHPNIPPAAPQPPPTPVDDPTPQTVFWLGHRYVRATSDIRIVGSGQVQGVAVLFALCNQEGDGCFFRGMIRMLPANASPRDWTYLGPY